MHHKVETPPPPAPLPPPESFQVTSTRSLLLLSSKLVPPTPITYGSLAGVRTLSRASAVASVEQLVEPLSPAAAKTVWPCAFACSNRASCAFSVAVDVLASQPPHDTDRVLSVSVVTHFLKMP